MLCLGLLLWLLMLCLLFVVGVGEAMVSNGAMVSIGGQRKAVVCHGTAMVINAG